MSCLSRKVVENRIKQREARENGNMNAVFCLMILGGLLFAGHSVLTQMHHIRHSMKDIFRSLVSRNAVKQVGNELASSEAREILPHIIKDNERE